MQKRTIPPPANRSRQPRLPSPAGALTEVVRMVSEPDPDLRAISRSLSRDPALTMRLLAAVNSGYYSLRSPITSVDRAVSFLGAQTLRSMMVCLLLKQVVAASRLGQYQLRTFWEGSLRRAVAARQLARASTMAAPDECFTIGLCQDLVCSCRSHGTRARASSTRTSPCFRTRSGFGSNVPAERVTTSSVPAG